ncbi:uncharacterized protein LAESUDRAFT_654559 [Laetiporus sulphureus 93-53]|uniref:Uncharacterized protein n=1 Tax=Laetiporus sulphureus 93-53 TaxID=1314785 RepID=A0A165E0B6_9APHY|nr:uncharacterized protein LAESUDRAFT_654559 [Laetiporus sulphureus 93-53]KZT06002.1 hypothetical protein LAESUDRAFT_654559 [Laetiporus sulphureus 93-53]
MSTLPGPSTTRGEITLQPSYFTSSLYVGPLREDITDLINLFSQQYAQAQPPIQPFALFKRLWTEQGWCWMHFKAFDGRVRESFIAVTERLFLERMIEMETPITRVVSLFALYTFYFTQPSTSAPRLHSVKHIAVPIDIYQSVLLLPQKLNSPDLLLLQPHARYVLTSLLNANAFHILPHSDLRPYNPSNLPREIFVEDGQESAVLAALAGETATAQGSRPPKKKGRPSKREKLKRAKDALVSLDKFIDKNTLVSTPEPSLQHSSRVLGSSGSCTVDHQETTHVMVTNPPIATRDNYRAAKFQLLHMLDPSLYDSASGEASQSVSQSIGRQALERTNEAVLARLKMIDQLAAERGLEVGGEGGEKTGFERVERAVQQLHATGVEGHHAGILNLLEGAGLDTGTG